MGYSQATITQAGQELLQRVIAGETTITFTKVGIGNTGIDNFVPKDVVSPEFYKDENNRVIGEAIFNNYNVLNSYFVETIAIYAKDNYNREIIFSYSSCDSNPDEMEAYDNVSPKTLQYNVFTGVTEGGGVYVDINPDGLATIKDLKRRWLKREVATRSQLPFPDGTHQAIDEVWWIADEKVRVVEQRLTSGGYAGEEKEFTTGTLANRPVPTFGAIYFADNTTWFVSVPAINTKTALEYVSVSELPVEGTYANGTYVYNTTAGTLHLADATLGDYGYKDLLNFEILDEEPEVYVDNTYYLIGDMLIYYLQNEWVETQVNSVEGEPIWDASTVDKYYYVAATTTLYFGVESASTYSWVALGGGSSQPSTTIVTIPATGWTTNTDAGGKTYYTIDITLAAMWDGFVGLQDAKPVIPEPYSVDDTEKYEGLFSLIKYSDSHDGYFTVYVNEIPTEPFDIYIYGL